MVMKYMLVTVPSAPTYGHSDLQGLENKINAYALEGWTLHSLVNEGRSWPHVAVMEREERRYGAQADGHPNV